MSTSRVTEKAPTAPAATNDRRGRRLSGFVPAAASFAAVFVAGATPIPLYPEYRRLDGITHSQFSIIAAVYFAAAVFALIVLGRLSNHLGRRPVALAALVLAIAGSAVFLFFDGLPSLLLGRGLQGLAAGVASSALTAYAVDTAPAKPRWLISTVTSAASNVGLAIGAFGSGFLVQYAPAPLDLIYAVVAGILIVCGIAIIASPETVGRNPGARRSLIPRLTVPRAARRFLPVAAIIFVATWSVGGYYQSFAPSIAADDLGTDSPVVVAAILASYMALSVLGGPLSARLAPATAQKIGMLTVLAAASGLVTAIAIGSAPLFIGAGVLGGVGMGTTTSGSIRVLLPQARPVERAGLLSVIYAISYTGAAIPSLIAGQLTDVLSLFDITVGYAVLVAIAFVVALVAARNPPRPEQAQHQ